MTSRGPFPSLPFCDSYWDHKGVSPTGAEQLSACTAVQLCSDAEEDLLRRHSSVTCKWAGEATCKTRNIKGLMVVGTTICRRQMKRKIRCFPEWPALLIKVCPHKAQPGFQDLNFRLNSPKCYKWKSHVLRTTFSNHSCGTCSSSYRHFPHHRFVLINTISSKPLSHTKL